MPLDRFVRREINNIIHHSTSMLTLSVVVPLWDGSRSVVFNVCSFLILTNYIQDLPYVVCTYSSMPL